MKHCILITFLFLLTGLLFAQTAARLEALIDEPAVNWEQAAAFVLEAADAGYGGTDDAFSFAASQNWLPKNIEQNDAVSYKGAAFLFMQSFKIKGGIFYRLTKSPHHAYREMVYMDVIRGGIDPDAVVSGKELLFMLNRLLSIIEEEAAKAVS
jgi:hypothetical protein